MRARAIRPPAEGGALPDGLLTERLSAVRPRREDFGDYGRLFGAPEVEKWLRPPPLEPFTVKSIDGILEADLAHWIEHDYGPRVLRLRDSGDFTGRAGLRLIRIEGGPAVEILWAVLPDIQGRGYATEAARAAIVSAWELGLDRLVSLTLDGNLASRRVMEKVGMSPAGNVSHAGLPHLLYEVSR